MLSEIVSGLPNYIQGRHKELHYSVPGVPIKRNDDTAPQGVYPEHDARTEEGAGHQQVHAVVYPEEPAGGQEGKALR